MAESQVALDSTEVRQFHPRPLILPIGGKVP